MIEIETIYRAERAAVLASLVRFLRNFDRAEEALHDAFLAASAQWPRDGIPDNPRAWLISVGRFKAIDRLRTQARHVAAVAELSHLPEGSHEMEHDIQEIEDDTLRLIFACCHPALSPDAQIALTLREVCGLKTEEIAAAFLARPSAVAQRIVRAKSLIAGLRLPFDLPSARERSERLETVLHVIYLIFNEGYAASRGDALIRGALCDEAIRLTRLLADLEQSPDAEGLLALLMLLHARRNARVGRGEELILLADQDRDLWDRTLIAEGMAHLATAIATPPLASYTIQAMIAARHTAAVRESDTDWTAIASLYDLLLRADPSPVVALNRAVAIAMRDGPEAGLSIIDELLAKGGLAAYRFAHSARADLLRRLNRKDAAREAYQCALGLTQQASERLFLERRLAELST